MSTLRCHISISLDGYVAGPAQFNSFHVTNPTGDRSAITVQFNSQYTDQFEVNRG
ncbi:hypothetical protein ACFQ1S_11555 [Kibdelosporangium lantanae]|uniref:Uncharacterized protein n=1 Tax=Kibdelosporangium lantanae TaxID=1497396 RepID=A0ABW3M622_9PSEU